MRRWLAELLYPQAFRDAQGYHRIKSRLDEARWWLGRRHPEAASLAHQVLDEDHWFWTSTDAPRDSSWTWQAPSWCIGIDSFRRWLDSRPFAQRDPV